MKRILTITALVTFVIFSFTGMSLAASADAEADSNASITTHSSNNRGGHLIDPGFQYGPVMNYFTKPLPSEGFQPVESLLTYATWFTVDALKEVSGGDWDAEADFMPINKELRAPGMFRITKNAEGKVTNKVQWIKIVVTKKRLPDAYGIGYVTARSDDRRVGMPAIMAAAAIQAAENGCNVLQVIAQGAVRDAHSTGWGIGFNTSYGKISGGSDNDKAVVGGGGLGYSSAKAGMRDLPWIQANGLWVTGLKLPPASKPVPEVQALIDADNARMQVKIDAANQRKADEASAKARAKEATKIKEVTKADPTDKVLWGTVNGKKVYKAQ